MPFNPIEYAKSIRRAIRLRWFKRSHDTRKRHPGFAIGKHTYGDPQVFAWGEGATLKIGAFCSIADGVKIYLGGEHRVDWVTTYPFSVMWPAARHHTGHPRTKGDVVIGNDVWIGADAVILSGVRIGDGAVIGNNSVVVKDVAPYAIVAGNPARFLKTRFDEVTVGRLLAVKWWEWDDARIQATLPALLNNDIAGFLERAEALGRAD
ncbi:MAG TPA: CatB-related O-acetyltransferase [Herpetosiphonaceae bacterium]|nr:CatB-related O-acetyltransferase [Herpetosiphonaceae bacterium]